MKILRHLPIHCLFRAGVFLLLVAFVLQSLCPVYAQTMVNLPAPGAMVQLSPRFVPPFLKGMIIHPENPFRLEFIVDPGLSGLSDEGLTEESNKLIKYFLASLTIPDEEQWVNLSPYEKDRIIPVEFAATELGRDLLAQDYLLKQLMASVVYPEKDLGKEFWSKVYQEAQAKYGTTDLPFNTFNKVWIVPQKAVVYEQGKTVVITQSRLKVMLEEDYVALVNQKASAESPTSDGGVALSNQKGPASPKQNQHGFADASKAKSLAPTRGVALAHENSKDVGRQTSDEIVLRPTSNVSREDKVHTLGSQILRELIIPAIETEVNEGKNFAALRQMYHSMILATWYKRKLKNSLLNKNYADYKKILGIDLADKNAKDQIYARYIEAFQKGVYNYIKEDVDPATQSVIPRKYFSGGFVKQVDEVLVSESTTARGNLLPIDPKERFRGMDTNFEPANQPGIAGPWKFEDSIFNPVSGDLIFRGGTLEGDKKSTKQEKPQDLYLSTRALNDSERQEFGQLLNELASQLNISSEQMKDLRITPDRFRVIVNNKTQWNYGLFLFEVQGSVFLREEFLDMLDRNPALLDLAIRYGLLKLSGKSDEDVEALLEEAELKEFFQELANADLQWAATALPSPKIVSDEQEDQITGLLTDSTEIPLMDEENDQLSLYFQSIKLKISLSLTSELMVFRVITHDKETENELSKPISEVVEISHEFQERLRPLVMEYLSNAQGNLAIDFETQILITRFLNQLKRNEAQQKKLEVIKNKYPRSYEQDSQKRLAIVTELNDLFFVAASQLSDEQIDRIQQLLARLNYEPLYAFEKWYLGQSPANAVDYNTIEALRQGDVVYIQYEVENEAETIELTGEKIVVLEVPNHQNSNRLVYRKLNHQLGSVQINAIKRAYWFGVDVETVRLKSDALYKGDRIVFYDSGFIQYGSFIGFSEDKQSLLATVETLDGTLVVDSARKILLDEDSKNKREKISFKYLNQSIMDLWELFQQATVILRNREPDLEGNLEISNFISTYNDAFSRFLYGDHNATREAFSQKPDYLVIDQEFHDNFNMSLNQIVQLIMSESELSQYVTLSKIAKYLDNDQKKFISRLAQTIQFYLNLIKDPILAERRTNQWVIKESDFDRYMEGIEVESDFTVAGLLKRFNIPGLSFDEKFATALEIANIRDRSELKDVLAELKQNVERLKDLSPAAAQMAAAQYSRFLENSEDIDVIHFVFGLIPPLNSANTTAISDEPGGLVGRWDYNKEQSTFDLTTGIVTMTESVRTLPVEPKFLIDGENKPRDIALNTRTLNEQEQAILNQLKIPASKVRVIFEESAKAYEIFGLAMGGYMFVREGAFFQPINVLAQLIRHEFLELTSMPHQEIRTKLQVEYPSDDQALTDYIRQQNAKDRVGGIDFNSRLLELESRGVGVNIPLNQLPNDDRPINGLIPTIIKVTPITSLEPLLTSSEPTSTEKRFL